MHFSTCLIALGSLASAAVMPRLSPNGLLHLDKRDYGAYDVSIDSLSKEDIECHIFCGPLVGGFKEEGCKHEKIESNYISCIKCRPGFKSLKDYVTVKNITSDCKSIVDSLIDKEKQASTTAASSSASKKEDCYRDCGITVAFAVNCNDPLLKPSYDACVGCMDKFLFGETFEYYEKNVNEAAKNCTLADNSPAHEEPASTTAAPSAASSSAANSPAVLPTTYSSGPVDQPTSGSPSGAPSGSPSGSTGPSVVSTGLTRTANAATSTANADKTGGVHRKVSLGNTVKCAPLNTAADDSFRG